MKCPKCGFNNVDWAESCKKCSTKLKPRYIRRKPAQPSSGTTRRKYEPKSTPPETDTMQSSHSAPVPTAETPQEERVSTPPSASKSSEAPPSGDQLSFAPPSREPQHEEAHDRAELAAPRDERPDESVPSEQSVFTTPLAGILGPGGETTQQPVTEAAQGEVEGDVGMEEATPLGGISGIEGYEEVIDYGDYDYLELAGLGSRLGAYVVDNVIIVLISSLTLFLAYLVSGGQLSVVQSSFVFLLVFLLLYILYFWILTANGGQTLGKKLFSIKVVSDTGEPVGLGKSFLRVIGYYLSSIVF